MEQIFQIINQEMQKPDWWRDWILFLVGPLFVGIYLLEWILAKKAGKAQHFTLQRAITNFTLGGSYLIFETIAKFIFIVPVCMWIYSHRLWTIDVNWMTALPIFVGVEFCYYWFHRASHRVRWFWSAHVVHHSDEAMNLSTAMRQSLLYSITGWWIFFTPMMFIGVHPAWVFFFYAVNLIYQFFIHTESVGKFPKWVEFIFDTPSNHRAHHGRNPQYIDMNYGGVLIIFDRLFGTYVEEKEAVDYGVLPPQPTLNPISLIFKEFVDMWRDVLQEKSLKGLQHLFLPPYQSKKKVKFSQKT